MSYLNALRLHFAGQFQANVSTVNNDPAHFDNAIFKPSYQLLEGPRMIPPNGWFSPQGDAAFRLLGCQITSAWMPAGQVAASDPVLQALVADSDGSVPAKMTDLDSEQQLVSEIWGLQVRIADSQGNSMLTGDFEPMAFIDIWDRALTSDGGDVIAGAMWQSVLQNLQWGNVGNSPFLTALQQAAGASGLLSIKFNLDGINMDNTSPNFMCGRIVGTIGPAASDEPHHLVIGRQFMAAPGPNANFFNPLGGINFCVGRVDTGAKCIFLDLGNALQTNTPGSGMANLGDLTLSAIDPIATPGNPAGTAVPLGTIPATGTGGYAVQGWYETTAGVVVLPLSDSQLQLIAATPLTISGGSNLSIAEWSSGAFVRADTFVYRMSPGDTVTISACAMQWGNPLVGASIGFSLDPSQLQSTAAGGFPFVAPGPNVATPVNVLTHANVPVSTTPPAVTTDSNGRGVLTLGAADPGNVRWFNNGQDYGIDGQVYGVRPAFTDPSLNTGPVNQWNFVSFLVWSGFTASDPVTWQDLAPIFQQYANLYPVMNRFLNLGDYDQVVANAGLLQLAFGLNPAHPNSMPATRDLSPAKRNAILSWLANPAYPKGQPGPVVAAARPPGPAPQPVSRTILQGGKSAAAARRLVLQST